MKRLQVFLPDSLYIRLQREAERKEATVADLVRRGIERQLESAIDEPRREPTITPLKLGKPLVPESEWREIANERGS